MPNRNWRMNRNTKITIFLQDLLQPVQHKQAIIWDLQVERNHWLPEEIFHSETLPLIRWRRPKMHDTEQLLMNIFTIASAKF